MQSLTPELVLQAYAHGYFPMADPDEDDALFWWLPERRTLLPVCDFHVPRRLARTIRSGRFRVSLNEAFEAVLDACRDRAEGTWISEEIAAVFLKLHGLGRAYSVEVWKGDVLAGGLYGLALGRAFFAESMFFRERDASKVALAELARLLCRREYMILDAQFMTEHLRQFGAYEVDDEVYQKMLQEALSIDQKADPLLAILLGTDRFD